MDSGFSVHTKKFEGPLDLLLTLIQERKLYINEISLAEVTDAYLGYLERYTEHPVAETTQFVYIAATLLLIKSRSLLPDMSITEEEASDIADLERRLSQYRIYKTAARKLGRIWNKAPLLPSGYKPKTQDEFTPGNLTLEQIHIATKNIVNNFPTYVFRPEVQVATTLTLEEVINKMQNRIQTTSRLLFSEIKKGGSKPDVIMHFLALLELVKGGIVTAEQGSTFDDILVANDSVGTPQY